MLKVAAESSWPEDLRRPEGAWDGSIFRRLNVSVLIRHLPDPNWMVHLTPF